MSQDGAIDYKCYSTTELREALISIDRVRFPLNFKAMQSELDTRTGAEQSQSQVGDVARDSTIGAEPQLAARSGRPFAVWLIMVFHALLLIVGVPSLIAASLGVVPLVEPFASYYAAFDFWDFFQSGISFALVAATLIALYRMKKIAFSLALANWVYGLVLAFWKSSEYEALGMGLTQTAVGRVLGLFVIFYLWYLVRKGRLT